MKYIVKDFFADKWFGDATVEEIEKAQEKGLTADEISMLAFEWCVPVDELMKQVDEV